MTFDTKTWLDENRGNSTLLGVCPMAEEIVEAALLEAKQHAAFVPMFIATPRQVDADRGYTGWSQDDLVRFIDETASRLEYDGQTVIARDHGGPYQSMRDRGDPSVDLSSAMDYAEELFIDDLESGFDILHVDATEDATVDGVLPLEEVTDRTTELIDRIEGYREEHGIEPVYFEVGTEEIDGGMTDPSDFKRYIDLLYESLSEIGRSSVIDRIVFIVGQIGTTMQIDMQNRYDPEKARTLESIVREYDLDLKVHYTDWLSNDDLATFPELGIGAANVGPEFAAAMVEGFERLESIEVEEIDDPADRSSFMSVFSDAAIRDAPWGKFAPSDLADTETFVEDNRRNIAVCVGRYVFNDPDVVAARQRLFDNVETARPEIDPHAVVVDTIRAAIGRYVTAFGHES